MDNLTRYLVAALLLVWSTPNFVLGQVIMTGHHRLIGTSVPVCPPPSGLISLWAARNPSNTCYPSATTCTNGANVDTVADLGSAANTLTTASSGTAPTYTTSAIGTNPAFTFIAANQTLTQLTTQFSPTGSAMFVVVLKPTASVQFSIFNSGATTSISCLNSLSWDVSIAGHSTVDNCFTANIFTDSGNTYSGVWAELYFTINFTSGPYTFGHCSVASGCVQDGSGSSTQPWSIPSNTIGGQIYSSSYSDGPLAELDYNTTGSTTGLATYLACQYPTI